MVAVNVHRYNTLPHTVRQQLGQKYDPTLPNTLFQYLTVLKNKTVYLYHSRPQGLCELDRQRFVGI